MKRSDIFRWTIAILILAFGLAAHDPKDQSRWFTLTIVLYAIPLIAQFVPRTWARVYGIYFGLFVMLQAVISAHFYPNNFIRRMPNINKYTDVRGNNLYGISGVQHLTSDAKGFRTTKSVNYDAKGDYRIFFIGASTVAQEFIDNKKTFAHLVQESLSKALERDVEVINTSVPGIRAIHHLETMRQVAKHHPDLYVIVPGANDWGLHITLNFDQDNPNRFAHTIVNDEIVRFQYGFLVRFRRYTLKHSLLGRGVKPTLFYVLSLFRDKPQVGFGNNPDRFIERGLFYKAEAGSLYRKDKRTFMPKSVHPGYDETMKAIVAFCKKSPAACVFVTHPHAFMPGATKAHRDRFWMTPAFEDYTLTFESMSHIAGLYTRYLIQLGRSSGVPVCDLQGQLEPSLDNFYDEIHVNLTGSSRVAEILHPCLLGVIRSKTQGKAAASK